MRCVMGWVAVAVLAGGWACAEEPKGDTSLKSEPPKVRTVPDRRMYPDAGDRSEIQGTIVPGARSFDGYHRVMIAVTAKDDVGIRECYADQTADPLPAGLPVLVIRNFRSDADRLPFTPYNYPVQVRILEGPLKDQVRFVPEDLVSRMKVVEKDDPYAAWMLQAAGRLEKARKAKGALTFYRQILKDYPGTESATKAAARIKALTGRP